MVEKEKENKKEN